MEKSFFTVCKSDRGHITKIYKESKNPISEEPTTQSKTVCKIKQRIHNREISIGWEVLQDMFKIVRNQRKVNQYEWEIPSYTNQND